MPEPHAKKPAAAALQPDASQAPAPDWQQFTPPELRDAVERIIAAGAEADVFARARGELHQAVEADAPVDQKLADNVVGLMLTLDQKAPERPPG